MNYFCGMNSVEIFQLALNLQELWYIKEISFKSLNNQEDGQLDS